MTAADVRPALDRLARHPRMRGVRQQLHWHREPSYRFAARPDLARDPGVQRNVARLADYGWLFELQVFAGQIPAACDLVDACPEVTFVLVHAGMLEDLSEAGRDLWRRQLAALARRPNVVAKLSGFGTFLRRNDPAHVGWTISETVLAFGAERCLFGSNFPIEKLWTSYSGLIDAVRRGAGGLAEGERAALFETTARRVYRL
jgi:predicted TIM-barrel fold metal-dependent hydrolase